MTANAFESEVSASIRVLMEQNPVEFFGWRLPDTKSFWNRAKYMPKQPGDFMCVCRSTPTLLELKSQKSEPSFTTNNIRPHQWKALQDMCNAGGQAFFLLNRRSTPHDFRCYAVPPTIMKLLQVDSGRKSIRWDKIKEHHHVKEIPRIKQLWDLRPLFLYGPALSFDLSCPSGPPNQKSSPQKKSSDPG